MNSIQTQEVKQELHRILAGMDIPEFRFDDLNWLNRNMQIDNSNHPNIILAVWLVTKLRESSNE